MQNMFIKGNFPFLSQFESDWLGSLQKTQNYAFEKITFSGKDPFYFDDEIGIYCKLGLKCHRNKVK
jgi:hypothetical protein